MIVVTGAGGFIGSVLAAELNRAGYSDLVIVDTFDAPEKWRNIAKRDFSEIVRPESLPGWFDRFVNDVEAVFHLGAISSTTMTDADLVIANNINYSIALWRQCVRIGRPLFYASSAATYGDGSAGFDDAADIAALKRLRPLNLYGWSKHAFDLWAMRESAAGRAPPLWVGLKFFNVFGPNEYHKGDMMSLVAKNYRRIASGETVRLFRSHRGDCADGQQRRDFIYVKDCAAVMLWFLKHARHSGLYNLGTGMAHSFRELLEAVGQACGVAPIIEYIDMPAQIRPNYQYFTEAKMARLRKAGYDTPFMPLEMAVADYVAQLFADDPYL